MATRVFKMRVFEMIDSHVHLDADEYPDPSGAIKRALYAGVTAMVVPGTGPVSNRKVMDLARKPVAFLDDGRVRKGLQEPLIARLRNKAPGGAIEILEALIYFTDSRHREFPLLPMCFHIQTLGSFLVF